MTVEKRTVLKEDGSEKQVEVLHFTGIDENGKDVSITLYPNAIISESEGKEFKIQ